jgi:hypothetical protein
MQRRRGTRRLAEKSKGTEQNNQEVMENGREWAARLVNVRRTQIRGFVERGVPRVVGLRAFRCGACNSRFFRFEGGSEKSAPQCSGVRGEIIPLYAVLLLASIVLSNLIRAGLAPRLVSMTENRLPWAPFLIFLQNIWTVRYGTLGSPMMAITWSLAVEEHKHPGPGSRNRLYNSWIDSKTLLAMVRNAVFGRSLLNI